MKITSLILFVLLCYMTEALTETINVRIRVKAVKSDEQLITRENLIKIKQFILKQGKRETYSNMYNNNPAFHTKDFRFYLNPDTGQQNINCDPAKSDFHFLVIRQPEGGINQYRTIEFFDKRDIYISASMPTDDLSVLQIRQFVEDATKQILIEIK